VTCVQEVYGVLDEHIAENNKYHPNHNDFHTHRHKAVVVNCLSKMTTGNGKVEKEK
jgi:hypothetical protein